MNAKQEAQTVEKDSISKAIEKKKTQQDFALAYDELCKKYGYQIAFVPQWKQSMDTGTFSLMIQMAVVENPKGQ